MNDLRGLSKLPEDPGYWAVLEQQILKEARRPEPPGFLATWGGRLSAIAAAGALLLTLLWPRPWRPRPALPFGFTARPVYGAMPGATAPQLMAVLDLGGRQ